MKKSKSHTQFTAEKWADYKPIDSINIDKESAYYKGWQDAANSLEARIGRDLIALVKLIKEVDFEDEDSD